MKVTLAAIIELTWNVVIVWIDGFAVDETEGLPTVELPRANLSGLDEDSLVGNIQSYRKSSAGDTTITNSALAHPLEDSLPSAQTEDLVIPGPEHRLPSLSLVEMSVGDVTLPIVEGAVEPPVTPRPGVAEYLSTSIVEPRSHLSEWAAGGDDDLDESVFNENAPLNIRSKEAVGISVSFVLCLFNSNF